MDVGVLEESIEANGERHHAGVIHDDYCEREVVPRKCERQDSRRDHTPPG